MQDCLDVEGHLAFSRPQFPHLHAGLGRATLGLGRQGLTAYEHGANGEDLLGVGIGTHVAKAHAGEAAQREVERSNVGTARRRAARRAIDVGHLQPLPQLVQPAWGVEGYKERRCASGGELGFHALPARGPRSGELVTAAVQDSQLPTLLTAQGPFGLSRT